MNYKQIAQKKIIELNEIKEVITNHIPDAFFAGNQKTSDVLNKILAEAALVEKSYLAFRDELIKNGSTVEQLVELVKNYTPLAPTL